MGDFEDNRFKIALDRTRAFYKSLPAKWEVVEQSIYEEVMPTQVKSDHLCWNGTDEIEKNETIIVIEAETMTTAAMTTAVTEKPPRRKHKNKNKHNNYDYGDYPSKYYRYDRDDYYDDDEYEDGYGGYDDDYEGYDDNDEDYDNEGESQYEDQSDYDADQYNDTNDTEYDYSGLQLK